MRISSTELPIIVGLSKFATPLDLWLVKKGLKERQPDNEYMRLGRRLEYGIFAEAKEEIQKKKILPIEPTDKIVYAPGILFTKDIFSCHIDAAVVKPNDEIKYLIEIKSTSMPIQAFEKYALAQYECQVMQQIYITGAQQAVIVVAPDGGKGELKYYYVFFDDEKWSKWEAEARKFYESLKEDNPPEWIIERSKEQNKELFEANNVFSIMEVDDDVAAWIVSAAVKLEELKAQKKELDAQIKAIEGVLSNAIKGNGEIKWNDEVIVKATTYESETFDKEKLKKEHPEIYEKYVGKTTKSRLTVAKGKKLQRLASTFQSLPEIKNAESLTSLIAKQDEDGRETTNQ